MCYSRQRDRARPSWRPKIGELQPVLFPTPVSSGKPIDDPPPFPVQPEYIGMMEGSSGISLSRSNHSAGGQCCRAGLTV